MAEHNEAEWNGLDALILIPLLLPRGRHKLHVWSKSYRNFAAIRFPARQLQARITTPSLSSSLFGAEPPLRLEPVGIEFFVSRVGMFTGMFTDESWYVHRRFINL